MFTSFTGTYTKQLLAIPEKGSYVSFSFFRYEYDDVFSIFNKTIEDKNVLIKIDKINDSIEGKPQEEFEIRRYAFDLAQNKQQYIGDIRYFAEEMAKLEEKIQARARLRVRQYRLENKKSQQDVANFLGIDISTYNKYEKGSRKLNNEVVRKIAEYYNIKVSDILD